jgi:hypothetical protein
LLFGEVLLKLTRPANGAIDEMGLIDDDGRITAITTEKRDSVILWAWLIIVLVFSAPFCVWFLVRKGAAKWQERAGNSFFFP